MKNPSFGFTRAITRRPAATIASDLRAQDIGNPVLETMLAAPRAYVAALRRTGADVIELEPL